MVGVLEDDDGEDRLIFIDPSMSKPKMQNLLSKLRHTTKYNLSLKSKKTSKDNVPGGSKNDVKSSNGEKSVIRGGKSGLVINNKNKTIEGKNIKKIGNNNIDVVKSNKKVMKKKSIIDREMTEFIMEPWRLNKRQYQLITVMGLLQNDAEWEVSFKSFFLITSF